MTTGGSTTPRKDEQPSAHAWPSGAGGQPGSLYWKRVSGRPYLSPAEGTLAPEAVTTPDLLLINDQLTLLAGAVSGGKEQIIRIPIEASDLEHAAGPSLAAASVVVETGPDEFDCEHVCDPAAVPVRGKIRLFYTAIGMGPDCIGQAISEDGRVFLKADRPVCPGRSPEVVDRAGGLYLFYVLRNSKTGYRIHLAVSEDLNAFSSVSAAPILDAGRVGSWDSYEMTTPRIFRRGSTYYMIYAGGNRPDRPDLPSAFGLARSPDLTRWEKYPGNPIFRTGTTGAWDDGAIWFGTVFESNGNLYLLYEGGRLDDLGGSSPGLTQVGLAGLPSAEFDQVAAAW